MLNSIVRKKALDLRKRGLSFTEIHTRLGISKSTAWNWGLGLVKLSHVAKSRLIKRKLIGQNNSLSARRRRYAQMRLQAIKRAQQTLRGLVITSDAARLICAILYWCEGSKEKNAIRFANSDSVLVATFMYLFRKGFKPDERKIRASLHLHAYHNDRKQKLFWSRITRIPLTNFKRSYIKFHTGKRKHLDYRGCISIRYYDTVLASEIRELYSNFGNKTGA